MLYGMKIKVSDLQHYDDIMILDDRVTRKIDIGRKYAGEVIPAFVVDNGITYAMFWKAGLGCGSVHKEIFRDEYATVSLCVYPKLLHALKALYRGNMRRPRTIKEERETARKGDPRNIRA